MIWFYIIAGVILLAAAVTVGASYYMFRFAIGRNDKANAATLTQKIKDKYKDIPTKKDWGYKIEEGIKRFCEQPVEEVYMTNREGMKLHGYLLECENATKTVIFSHGWHSDPLFDFSCIWEYYVSHKFNVLIIVHRGHGKSDGKYVCFGVKERFDVIDWANWVNERFGENMKIFLSGISMGSATVMMAVGTEGLPKSVVGASCDCGYTSARDIFKHVLKVGFHLPSFPIINVAKIISKLVAKLDFDEFTSVDGLKSAKIPIYFIHGTADGFVPVEHTYKNRQVCASEYTEAIVENADHGLSFFTDPDAVRSGLEELLKKVFDDFE